MTAMEAIIPALRTTINVQKLPRVFYNGNAYNLGRSIVLRVPQVNDSCLVVCDCIHHGPHKCESICDTESYNSCSNHATSGAESINRFWVSSKSHMSFLDPGDVVSFLAVRAVCLNVKESI